MRKAAFLLLFALLACPAFAKWKQPDLSADLPKKLVQADPTTMKSADVSVDLFKNGLVWKELLEKNAIIDKNGVAVLSDDIVKESVA